MEKERGDRQKGHTIVQDGKITEVIGANLAVTIHRRQYHSRTGITLSVHTLVMHRAFVQLCMTTCGDRGMEYDVMKIIGLPIQL